MSYKDLYERMINKELVRLDGGTGTELQKRGCVMDSGAWCGPVSLSSRALLEEIHLDYIEAGADIITANTYATSRIMLREAGMESSFKEINTIAVEAALSARERSGKKGIVVAGSVSHMIPLQNGTDRVREGGPSPTGIAEAFEELSLFLGQHGCDLILLEMMHHPERIGYALAGAKKAGLPLWAGFSLQCDNQERLVSFGSSEYTAEEVFSSIDAGSVDVMGLMHTGANLISPGLKTLKESWSGPLSAYPDSGFFKMPHWQFEKILTPEKFLDFSKEWVEEGVSVIGGCCGLGPEHIAELKAL